MTSAQAHLHDKNSVVIATSFRRFQSEMCFFGTQCSFNIVSDPHFILAAVIPILMSDKDRKVKILSAIATNHHTRQFS